ncbi:DUF2642 domain-containing protein [Paenibacillus sp.]|uniref:DUF2642 domain-containing protein n=1 Tax=Paenibacillus sp. TaxID=58172 RepID=UPI002D65CA50|nr:DUF2642 domain-containing protein [Paenibacillus sp.]HZG58283.1 DUF2642 domain-containing protein [Paenibacillus sp.]
MKVTFNGSVKGEANVRKAGGGSGSSSSRRAVRAIRSEIRRGVRRIRRDLRKARRDIRRNVRSELRRELYSDRFANFIRGAVANNEPFREIALGLVNEAVQVETSAGAVSGTLIEVGTDYMVVRETPSTILVVPFRNVEAIQPL